MKKQPPVKKFTVGNINVSIWKNDGRKGPIFSAHFERRYKDGEEWKSSHSFLLDRLDDLIAAAEMAKTYAPLLKRIDQNDNPEE